MVSVDGSALIQIINFILLVLVLNIVLYKPIRGILKQRREKIDGLEKSIETFADKAAGSEQEFAAGIRQARTQGLKEKDALISEAAQEEQKIISSINEKAQADLAAARAKIAGDIDGIRSELQKEIDSFAGAVSEKILGRAL